MRDKDYPRFFLQRVEKRMAATVEFRGWFREEMHEFAGTILVWGPYEDCCPFERGLQELPWTGSGLRGSGIRAYRFRVLGCV